jgi:hypothetical protein
MGNASGCAGLLIWLPWVTQVLGPFLRSMTSDRPDLRVLES